MPTPKSKRNKRSRSSCPDGWHAAGYSVPIHLTVKQQRYCRRAIGINRFVYNLCVATHRFCRANRLPWPSWQDLYKAFNACKREDYPFATTVASRVAEGAFMDFGTAIKNWRDTDHQAGPPCFHKKRSTGTGSFRAASGISQIKYNGKRRIQIPGLGPVKLRHTLPKGIVYEAHIKFLNGQWAIGIKMWQPPKPAPQPESRIDHGAVDTGINPLGTDSEGQDLAKSQGLLPSLSAQATSLATRPSTAQHAAAAAGGRLNDISTTSTAESSVYAATPSIR